MARLRAGSRREEIEAARARVAAVDAQIATLEKSRGDAVVRAPIDGIVSERLLDPGEMAAPRAPIVVLTDLDHAWAEVFVDEPQVPRIKLGQPATVFTDAGGPGLPGKVSFIASKAEFTPRNVQTAEDRSKLVYRVKISVDNRQGVLKQGMPVEVEIPLRSDVCLAARPRHEEVRRRRRRPRSVDVGRSRARCSASSGPTARARRRRSG